MKSFSAVLFIITTLSLLIVKTDSVYGKSHEQPQNFDTQYYKFRVFIKDKGHNECTLTDPSHFLTEKAIERKKIQGVVIDERDLPISKDYFNLIEKAGCKVVSYSKWFSTIVVRVSDSLKINNIKSLSFVDSVQYVWRGSVGNYKKSLRPRLDHFITDEEFPLDTIYGYCEPQFKMHNATILHESGYRGKGIEVGVIDAGFTNFDVIPAFSTTNFLGYTDFVPEGDIFSSSSHGTKVLSTMAVDLPGLMVGSAPEASYYLLRSEDSKSEFPVEEDYWVRAIEYADSIGLDIINTSLGYSHFDDKALSYTHNDLNGEVSIMSRAADLAFEKGMIVIVSAGNEGEDEWQKSTPPADAKNVIAVGAVSTDSVIAPFSSHGFMADGRIKPDLVSVGRRTITIGEDGTIGRTNGTSLSSPFLAGLITSLWSVNPELHRSKLLDIIIKSADRYENPDTVYGYGIPDFQKALREVEKTLLIDQILENQTEKK